MRAILLLLSLTQGQENPDEVRAKIAVAVAVQQLTATKAVTPVLKKPSYEDAYGEALAKRMPFIVGVGCDPPKSGDWLTFRVEGPWHTWDKPVILISIPDGDHLWKVEESPPWASRQDVSDALLRWRGKRVLERSRPVSVNSITHPEFTRSRITNC